MVPRLSIAVALLAITVSMSHAAPPVLTTLAPRGVERGKPIEVVVTGTSLTPSTTVWLPFPAAVKPLPEAKPNPAQLKFQVTAEASVPVGVYPVRTVYPASLSAAAVGRSSAVAPAAGGTAVPGADGAGVTVAVLDTGIDASHPSLSGRVLPGIDLIDADRRALPRRGPDGRIETHGTRMAGMDCAEVSPAAWPSLRDGILGAVAVSDDEAVEAIRELAALGYAIGDCGAAPLAALRALMTEGDGAALRAAAGLDSPTARVLLVATEGVTDPDSYRRAVSNGGH